MQVALFASCLIDQFRPEAGLAAIKVLERAGCEVAFDHGQTCCGQPAFNAGYLPEAAKVSGRTIERLAAQLRDGCEAIVCPSGSCTAMLRHAAKHVDGGEGVAGRTFELSAFLVDHLGHPELGACWHGRVSWHDACHGLRELGVQAQPRTLLARVRGLELVEATSCERCCGFGGTFSTAMPGISVAMADDKIDELETLGIDAVASSDASCLMQLDGRLRERGSHIKGVHLAEILASQDAPR